MEKLHLSIVSPEKAYFDGEIDSVVLPGAKGRFAILPRHAPIVSSLNSGKIVYSVGGKENEVEILSGFVEMAAGRIQVYVECPGV